MLNSKQSRLKLKPKQTAVSVALLSVFLGGIAMFMGHQAVAENPSKTTQNNDTENNDTDNHMTERDVSKRETTEKNSVFKPQILNGHVAKRLEQFSLTTDQGIQYHVYDPNHLLDKLAKQRHIHDGLYEMDGVKVKAMISGAGNYGHMGYYEHQITVLGLEKG